MAAAGSPVLVGLAKAMLGLAAVLEVDDVVAVAVAAIAPSGLKEQDYIQQEYLFASMSHDQHTKYPVYESIPV